MRRIRKRNVFAIGVVAAIATAFAVTAATVQAGSGVPTSIGKGEGRLNVIEWAALHRQVVRQQVPEADGLHHPPQGRRLLAGDVRAHARPRRRRRRPVRPRLGFGRREPAAHLRARRQADQHQADPELEAVPAAVQVPAAQHGQRGPLRRLGAVGTEHLHLQHQEGEAGSEELEPALQQEVRRAHHDPEQPDPDRRRGALPRAHEAEPRDQGSLRADAGAALTRP